MRIVFKTGSLMLILTLLVAACLCSSSTAYAGEFKLGEKFYGMWFIGKVDRGADYDDCLVHTLENTGRTPITIHLPNPRHYGSYEFVTEDGEFIFNGCTRDKIFIKKK